MREPSFGRVFVPTAVLALEQRLPRLLHSPRKWLVPISRGGRPTDLGLPQLVWRVSRLGAIARDASAPPTPDQSIVSIFNLLNVRLEAVRTRHEQLEPADNLSTDEGFFRPKRSTICSTRGVKEAPWALYETGDEAGPVSEVKLPTGPPRVPNVNVRSNNTERLQEEKAAPENPKADQNAVSKVVSWLKGGRSKKSGRADRPKPIAVPPLRSPAAAQEWPTVPLPTKVETGHVVTEREQPPTSRTTGSNASPDLTRQGSSASTTSNREKRRSRGSAFFAFEFENGVVSRADVDPNLLSPGEPAAGATSPPPTSEASSPTRPQSADRASALSPRVSVRFSKRSSILPPAALDLLKSTGVDEVPTIPERFRRTVETGYDRRLHPYAVRGLRDYEDALDEWTDWVARLQEEEEEAPSAFDIVSTPVELHRLDVADMEISFAGSTPGRQLAAELGGKLKMAFEGPLQVLAHRTSRAHTHMYPCNSHSSRGFTL